MSGIKLITPKNVSGWIYGLVAEHFASYYEIKYKLTVWDVLDLIEILMVKESNTSIIADEQIEKSKK